MVCALVDRICDTTTTVGTGDVTLSGSPVTGYRAFSSSGLDTTNSAFTYLIEAVDASGAPTGEWEAGMGLLSGTTLTRHAVTGGSNGSSLVNFSAGTKRVHLAATATAMGFKGGHYSLVSDLTAQNFTSSTAIAWHSGSYEIEPMVEGFHDNSLNQSRLTFPNDGYGHTVFRLSAQLALANVTASDYAELSIRESGGIIPIARKTEVLATTTPSVQIMSPILSGNYTAEYFELYLKTGTSSSVTVKANESWFQLEILE